MSKLKLVAAGAAGFVAAYLLDPDRGRSRRARLADQAAARGRRASAFIGSRLRYQKGVARGVVHRVTSPFRKEGEDQPGEDTLLQKVRSEAVGQWKIGADDPNMVDIAVNSGNVSVSGTVANEDDRDRLIDLILDVDGVDTLEDRLTVVG